MNSTIRTTILTWLTRRDYSQQEIMRKLNAKGHASEEVNPVIFALTEVGLINDARFAENYIDARRRKGYGPLRIALELQARGISQETIAERLNITDNAWFVEARRVWQKKFKGELSQDYQTRAKQMRFLQYRGFTQEHIDTIYSATTGYDDT